MHIDILHDFRLCILILITLFVGGLLLSLVLNKTITLSRKVSENVALETVWTIFPGLILLVLGNLRLELLYKTENIVVNSSVSIKVLAHQWYWRYQYSDFNLIEFDSYLLPTETLNKGDFRLLEVDNRIIVPLNRIIRLIITSTDVLHSWALPRFGLKMDAVPGRLNQIIFFNEIPGVFYGQCSEICGVNHSFIPIVLESTSPVLFKNWILRFK